MFIAECDDAAICKGSVASCSNWVGWSLQKCDITWREFSGVVGETVLPNESI
jgi:hypothetical protein